MEINIQTVHADSLNEAAMNQVYDVVAAGFGRRADSDMNADTLRHVHEADVLQLATSANGRVEAVAMYGSSLWRSCR